MTTIIDGNAIAQKVRDEASAIVSEVKQAGIEPGLAVILVGDDPASATYVRMKEADCEKCGIIGFDMRRPAGITSSELDDLIDSCNEDPRIHGILVQMPLPSHLDAEAAIARISPDKDADGFHPQNLGKLVRGLDAPRACTPWGVMRLLEEYGIDVEGKEAVVVGRSTIVGKPMALMLLEANATVTVAHSRSRDLASICSRADILVSAVGKPNMITHEFVKPGAVVIDVGMNRLDSGLVGDVAYDEVAPLASAITPVPGGVGPMTRAMLMLNTAELARTSLS